MSREHDTKEIRVRLQVTGHVQGVGFRKAARQTARKLGIEATAVNRDDGSVIIEATGPRDAVETFIQWARIGPPLAEVDNVTVTGPGYEP